MPCSKHFNKTTHNAILFDLTINITTLPTNPNSFILCFNIHRHFIVIQLWWPGQITRITARWWDKTTTCRLESTTEINFEGMAERASFTPPLFKVMWLNFHLFCTKFTTNKCIWHVIWKFPHKTFVQFNYNSITCPIALFVYFMDKGSTIIIKFRELVHKP